MCYNNIVRSCPRLAFVPPGAFFCCPASWQPWLKRLCAGGALPCPGAGSALREGENQWLTGTAYAPWRRGQDSNLRKLGPFPPQALTAELPRRVIFQRRTGVPADPPQERIMPRFPRWQWDSAHHGPVFPGCSTPYGHPSGVSVTICVKGGVRYRLRIGHPRTGVPTECQAPHLALPLGRDDAPGGRRSK